MYTHADVKLRTGAVDCNDGWGPPLHRDRYGYSVFLRTSSSMSSANGLVTLLGARGAPDAGVVEAAEAGTLAAGTNRDGSCKVPKYPRRNQFLLQLGGVDTERNAH